MNIELHPAIVHFPIALISLAYLYQIITVIKPRCSTTAFEFVDLDTSGNFHIAGSNYWGKGGRIRDRTMCRST